MTDKSKKLIFATVAVGGACLVAGYIVGKKHAEKNHVKGTRRARLAAEIDNPNISASEIDEDLVTGYKGIYNRYVKRGIDIVLSSTILALISPVMLATSAAIAAEDGLPVFYRAERGGYHNKPFKIFKFRSMVKNADKIGGGTTALHDDRITKVGNILRKTKVDEFPNVINVLKGDMSFIGPRPELLQYTDQYKDTEKLILEVRPGMTDYSSIEFINLDEIVGGDDADTAYEEKVLPRKNKLRVKYAADVSFETDAKIFMTTVGKVLDKAYGFLFKHEHQ